jgi:cation diffusion facilitator CzcD-associated flavoprotein CzcO
VKDDIVEILPHAVRTATKTYPADVVIFATGFQTQRFLNNLKIHGKKGELLNDHWKQMGGPGAYHTTAVHGCKSAALGVVSLTDVMSIATVPNFFLLYGPNSNTGHTSVVLTTENTVNYVLKVLAPVLNGEASEVEVKANAEREYVARVQATSKTRVISKCDNVRLLLVALPLSPSL